MVVHHRLLFGSKPLKQLSELLLEYRHKTGLRREDIAHGAGISLAMLSKLETGRAKSTSHWRDLANVLGIPHAEFIESMPQLQPAGGAPKSVKLIRSPDGSYIGRAAGLSDSRTAPPELSPVMGSGDEPIDHAPTPPELQNVRGGYMVYATDSAMEPRFFVGERLSVHPGRPYAAGDFVVVALADGARVARKFVRWNGDDLVLAQYAPPQEIRVPRADVQSVHRVLIPGL